MQHCQCVYRYDSHRDAILRSGETHQAGGDGGVTPGQRPTDEIDPFQYFSAACFSGYNDGAKVSQKVSSDGLTGHTLLDMQYQHVCASCANLLFAMDCRRILQTFTHKMFDKLCTTRLQDVTTFSPTMQGFYTVYSGVFQKLAEEERQAAASQDAAFPPFGQYECCLYSFCRQFGVFCSYLSCC